jgi:4-hydroxybutyrate CoA-transferase
LDWKTTYASKLCTADEAVSHIKSGDTVVLAHCVGEPPALVDAMIRNRERYENVEIRHFVRLAPVDFTTPGYERHFRANPLFASASCREALADNRADFTPCFFHEFPKLLRDGKARCDVLLCQTSPPDEHGYVSLGTSVDYTLQAIRTASKAIVQINSLFPRTFGDGIVHISEFDHIVEADTPLYELPPPEISDVEKAIGENCATLVEDGSTLQLGIGAIPDAVMLFLRDKRNLGIHSEMISDGTLELYEEGIITGSEKSMGAGKMTVTFLMGTRRLYDFVHNNPAVEVRPVDYVNHPAVIMRQHKMVGINSALQVDLQGQVNAEHIGGKQYSGVGGQVDFVRGASMADGGKSIIAMPSSVLKKDGTRLSRIVPRFDAGVPVTTTRNDVDYIITEYGIAPMKNVCLRERARSLIGLAHPELRPELEDAYERGFSRK